MTENVTLAVQPNEEQTSVELGIDCPDQFDETPAARFTLLALTKFTLNTPIVFESCYQILSPSHSNASVNDHRVFCKGRLDPATRDGNLLRRPLPHRKPKSDRLGELRLDDAR